MERLPQVDQYANLQQLLRYLDQGGFKPNRRKIDAPVQHKQNISASDRLPILLGQVSEIVHILNTSGKFSNKRNYIAHNGDALSQSFCQEYIQKLSYGLDELQRLLDRISWL